MSILSCLTNARSFDESREVLQSKGLVVKDHAKLGCYLVKYDKSRCDMVDSDVIRCRGMILDKETNRVLCAPPEKSIQINQFLESVGEQWSDVKIEDFVDGTMINIFYH